jgi:hypothetical protein
MAQKLFPVADGLALFTVEEDGRLSLTVHADKHVVSDDEIEALFNFLAAWLHDDDEPEVSVSPPMPDAPPAPRVCGAKHPSREGVACEAMIVEGDAHKVHEARSGLGSGVSSTSWEATENGWQGSTTGR